MRFKYWFTGTPFLSGFENNCENGTDELMNFILSNGDRSTQRDGDRKYYDHMIPADVINRIRSITIHYLNTIGGFCFFDKDGALLWKIGGFESCMDKETVEIAENERIIGVKAKLWGGFQSIYSDWQFQIGKFV